MDMHGMRNRARQLPTPHSDLKLELKDHGVRGMVPRADNSHKLRGKSDTQSRRCYVVVTVTYPTFFFAMSHQGLF